jgi:crossover junction endodeoxyribonuclease RuvC
MKLCCGIDPGSKGAIVCLNEHGNPSTFCFVKGIKADGRERIDIKELRKQLIKIKEYQVFLENPAAMPKQGVSSTFKFGQNLGIFQGMLHGLEIPFILVSPQTWSAKMCVKDKTLQSKEKSYKAFVKLWPHCKDLVDIMPKYKREAIVDAALIARFGFDSLKISSHAAQRASQGFL